MRVSSAVALILLLLPTFASASWKRHVLRESRRDGRELVLIMDEDSAGLRLPRLIHRESFAKNETREMHGLLARAASLRAPNVLDLTPTDNPLWPIENAWTEAEEARYSAWVKQIAAEDFLVGSGLSVDCADYAIALRWIYSHDRRLPAGDGLAATGKLFGSWSSTTAWDQLPADADWRKDERFKTALKYLLNASFTHSIFKDLYPVAIAPEFVNPGTVYLTLTGDSGHTRTIFSIGRNARCSDCILIIWGNEPAAETGYITDFVPVKLAPSEGGFLRFRWPELTAAGWRLREADAMPGYSTEQYAWDDGDYLTNVANRLNIWQSPEARFKMAGDNTFDLLAQRRAVTMMGFLVCSLVPCSPQDSIYSSYSTPVRDQAIAKSIASLQNSAKQIDRNSQEFQDFQNNYNVPVFLGAPITYFEVLLGNQNARFNSDPRAEFFARWGVDRPNAGQKLQAYFEIAADAFLYPRRSLISRAQNLCFPNRESSAVCDPNDPKVKALNTERLDQGLRALRALIKDNYKHANGNVRATVEDFARNATFEEDFCPNGPCSMYDFLFGPVDHFAAMKSNADATRRERYGF